MNEHEIAAEIARAGQDPGAGGGKSRGLRRLEELGLPVPPFVVVPSRALASVLRGGHVDEQALHRLVTCVGEALAAPRYAVRSDAACEDARASSLAGQFHTELDVTPDRLGPALVAVMRQASERLGSLDDFSVIVQCYIDAEHSGVAFTRAPEGGREMVIEYGLGARGDVVGGKVTPIVLRVLRGAECADPIVPPLDELVAIEDSFGCPQDIEWCRRGNEHWIVQARPITTISEEQIQLLRALDRTLPRTPFFYEKTEIAEIAPRPSRLTFSLLERIYGEGGPVGRVYRRYGVSYRTRPSLVLVGAELYCNREEELKSLLPAMSYFHGSSISSTPRLRSLKGLGRTLRNGLRLATLSPSRSGSVEHELRRQLGEPLAFEPSLAEAERRFHAGYETVFEVNLLADLTVKRLSTALRGCPLPVAAALSGGAALEAELPIPVGLEGNTVAIEDLSPFVPTLSVRSKANGEEARTKLEETTWFRGLSLPRRLQLEKLLAEARQMDHLRECGRWLTVLLATTLRRVLHSVAARLDMTLEELLLFTLEEIERGPVSKTEAAERRTVRDRLPLASGAARLTSPLLPQLAEQSRGLSAGAASGRLVRREAVSAAEERPILYTPFLDPTIVASFGEIGGIVSERGGVLSHLAIMARERRIPLVVVGERSAEYDLAQRALREGLRIEISGDSGSVRLDERPAGVRR